MSAQHLLVVDSGIGGFTVLQHIERRLPSIVCHYLADNAFFPYGNKTESAMEKRIEQLLTIVLERQQLSAVVIACNSASTAVLEYLRQQFSIPFIGVVPAIKPAAEISKKKNIGLLATEGTVNRPYTHELIEQFAADCEVTKVASPDLVQMAERFLNTGEVDEQKLSAIIQPFIDADTDVCVLGCTHFPWFTPMFQRLAPSIQWIDSGDAIARRVEQILGVQKEQSTHYNSVFYYTGKPYAMKPPFLHQKVESVLLSVDQNNHVI